MNILLDATTQAASQQGGWEMVTIVLGGLAFGAFIGWLFMRE